MRKKINRAKHVSEEIVPAGRVLTPVASVGNLDIAMARDGSAIISQNHFGGHLPKVIHVEARYIHKVIDALTSLLSNHAET